MGWRGEERRTFDVALLVERAKRGHERGALRRERRVRVLRRERRVVHEQLLLDRLQLREVVFLVVRCSCRVLS